MSAVSMNVTPRSRARWMVAIDSSQSVAPYHSLMPMQPRPWADTVSGPSLVLRMCVPCSSSDGSWLRRGGLERGVVKHGVLKHGALLGALLGGGHAVRVVVDLRVKQLQALPLAGEGPAHLLAVLLQQLDAFRLARARPDQLGVPLHVTDRHPGRAQLGDQRQPLQVALAEPAAPVAAPFDVRQQADPLVPAQRVLGKTALGGGFADAPGRHVNEPTS